MSNTPYRWVIRGIKREIDRDGIQTHIYKNNGTIVIVQNNDKQARKKAKAQN